MKFIPYTLFAITVIFASLSSTGSDKQKKLWKCMAFIELPGRARIFSRIIQAETELQARQIWNQYLKNDTEFVKGKLTSYLIQSFNPSTDILK